MDQDKAGIEGAKNISEKYSKDFNFIFPNMLDMAPDKDLADYNSDIVKRVLTKILKDNKYL